MDGLAAVLAVSMAAEVPKPRADSRGLLPVVPTAVDVVPGGDRDAAWIQYDVRESYPAVQTTGYLIDAMAQRGWNLVQVTAFRTVETSEMPEWVRALHLDRKRGGRGYVWGGVPIVGRGHVWEAWWRDRSGRGVALKLEYKCPMEQQGLHSVWVHVSGTMYRPDEAARQEAERKRIQDERRQWTCGSGAADPTCRK